MAETNPHEIIKNLGLAYFNDQKERLKEPGSVSAGGEQTYDELMTMLERQDYFTPAADGRSVYEFLQGALDKYENHGMDVSAAAAAKWGGERGNKVFDDYRRRAALVRTILENIEKTR